MNSISAQSMDRLDNAPCPSGFQRFLRMFHEQGAVANVVGVLGALCVLACLIALPPAISIRVLLYATASIWVLLRPRMALYLLPFAVPWGSLDALNLGGMNLTSGDILVFLLAVSWLLGYVIRNRLGAQCIHTGTFDRESYNLPRILTIGTIVLLAAMCLSIPTAFSLKASLKEIAKWLEVALILCLGTQYIRTRRQVWTLVILCSLAALSQAFMGYAQYAFNLGPQSFIRDQGLRVYGTFDQPNPYAGYIDMTLLVTGTLMLLGRNWLTQLAAGLVTLLLGIAFALAQSRGGQIALVLALLFVFIAGFPRFNLLVRIGVIALLLGIAGYCSGIIPEHYVNPILNKLGLTGISFASPSNDDFSTAERLAHWIAGLNMFLDHPFFGVGIGNYPVAYPKYFITIFNNSLGHAHNYYINIAAEAGIFGLIGLLTFLSGIFLVGRHALQSMHLRLLQLKTQTLPAQIKAGAEGWQQRLTLRQIHLLQNDYALAIGLIASLLAICIHNFFDNLYVHSMTNLFALLIVLLVRLPYVTRQEEQRR
ncbi:O-antigen polymerase [Ktedonobacter sp. SOSP1-52]|uniref:O-antigen ligase family protein n=1 Tax=Ktedonobacter sp. SOSP1-52 TaxID=2778366 RepID=UPI001916AC67|nr:O-antigen ligase family protein [Ktedonobacter sp. SOSP1-52]GHO65749.1 O-antigen polymerase [Ktedonobacter sp. SOSP1-52]